MAERTSEVDHIHCGGCEHGIRGGLQPVEGIEDVIPDQWTNQVRVILDESRIDETGITEILAETGSPVRRAPPSCRPVSAGVDDRHETLASGVNTAIARIAGLVAIAALPAISSFDLDIPVPELLDAIRTAMFVTAAATALAGLTAAMGIVNDEPTHQNAGS